MEIDVRIDRGYGPLVKAEWLKDIVSRTLIAEKADPKSEMSLLITGQEKIHNLNREFLGEDRPTDVLSFPMREAAPAKPAFVTPRDGVVHLGEVIISFPQALTQAAEHGHSVKREVAILLIHGVLHILGYDHDITTRKRKMQAREVAILASIPEQAL